MNIPDTQIRHIVSFVGFLVVVLAYFAGYFSGLKGWWWTVALTILIYITIYKLFGESHHH